MRFLIVLAQFHDEFRVPELRALAEQAGLSVSFENYRSDSPFLVVDFESEKDARDLIKKSILTRGIYELFCEADTYQELHERNKDVNYRRFTNSTFKFDIMSYNSSRPKEDQLAIFESFDYMPLEGEIKLKNPQEVFTVIEDFGSTPRDQGSSTPKHIYMTRAVGKSSRSLIDIYSLKKRKHIGTTSFDAELAFVTCVLAKIKAGDSVYDPFSGTGSFPVAAAGFGALVVASDIDVRPLKQYGLNFKQYSTSHLFMDAMAMDFTHNALRQGFQLDAIICDPPYGVREGLKVCGSKDPIKHAGKEHLLIDNVPAHLRRDYIQPKRPYEFGQLIRDLLNFSVQRLRAGGRLAFWMPVAKDESLEAPLHSHLRLVESIPQHFSKWSRYLLVYELRPEGELGAEAVSSTSQNFRQKYFSGFKEQSPPI